MAAAAAQGLFDRSECLHPHPPVRSWTPEGFDAAIELIYDGQHVLHDGVAPDFEAYRSGLNESLRKDSITIGQHRIWLDRERKKERARRSRDHRLKWEEKAVKNWWRPSYDNGPGVVAEVAAWQPKAKRAIFKWERERRRSSYSSWERSYGYGKDESATLPESIAVDARHLFNVSAYKPGDFRKFFADPRTRRDYVRWAPFLLTAEDWHAAKTKKQRNKAEGRRNALDDAGFATPSRDEDEDE